MCVGLSYHVWYAFVALLCVGVLEVEPASMCVGAGSFFWCVGFLVCVCYSLCMNKSGKGINPGPSSSPIKIAKPSGGGRVGPALVYAANPHPSAKKGGRTGKASDAMKGQS